MICEVLVRHSLLLLGIVVAVVCVLGCGPAQAQTLVDPDDDSVPSLTLYRALAEQAPADCPEVAFPTIPPGALQSELVVDADALAAAGSERIVFSEDALVERLLILSQDARGCVHLGESGRLLPLSARSVYSPLANSALPPELGPTPVLAVVIDTKTVLPWLGVMDRQAFGRLSSKLWTVGGVYIGMLVIMLLLGVGLAMWRRDAATVAYVLYIATLCFYQAEMTAFGPAWIPYWPGPEHFRLVHLLAVIAVLIGIITMMIAFLEPKGWAKVTLIAATAVTALGFGGSFVLPVLYRVAMFAFLVVVFVAIAVLIARRRSGQSAARWFAAGVVALLLAALLQALAAVTGGDGVGAVVALAMPVAALSESGLWLVALLIRFNDDRQAMQRQLVEAANQDALTGTANRYRLRHEIEQVLGMLRRSDDSCGLLFIDLNGFKRINDRFGHAVGDDVLRGVASALDGLAINKRVLGRFGCDELILLMACPSRRAEVMGAAHMVVERLKEPVWSGAQGVAVRGSVGVVLLSGTYRNVDEVIADADIALYTAKCNGGARVEEFKPQMRVRSAERSQLREALSGVLERGELELYYQPIFCLCTARPVGLEVLLRWNHPDRGTLAAAEFVRFADEMDLGAEIGAWVIDRAFAQVRSWQRAGCWEPGAFVSFNISRQQLAHQRLVGQLEGAFARYSVDPTSIRLDIAEGLLEKYLGSAGTALRHLRGLGVMVGVDDFGSGASSLRLLSDLEPVYIKIDVGVIEGTSHVFRSQEVIQGIIALASTLGCTVVAEGVETDAQKDLLHQLGCDQAQGFKLAAPMTAAQAEPWAEMCRTPTVGTGPTSNNRLH